MKAKQNNDKLFVDVGERLRQLRGNKSQKQMAKDLDVPFRSYCRYEAGERPPPMALSSKIARVYETTIDWIMGGIPVEDGDQFRENIHRHHLIGQLVGQLELSLKREEQWFERQGFKYPQSEDETFQGWRDFTKWLREWYEQTIDTKSGRFSRTIERDDLPPEIIMMTQWLGEYWASATEDEKIWIKVQFRKCFPQFVEWSQK